MLSIAINRTQIRYIKNARPCLSTRTPESVETAAIYVRVPSDRQAVDLSVSAPLKHFAENARANGYEIARE